MKSVIVINGGTGTLGAALAERLAADYTVVLLARHQDKLEPLAARTGAEYQVVDSTEADQLAAAVTKIEQAHGRIDCLINAVGGWFAGLIEDNDPTAISGLVQQNVLAPMLAARAVIPGMKQAKAGLIINLVSQAGLYAKAGESAYAATKFAITGFTRALEKELKDSGIRVTGVYPGGFSDEKASARVLPVAEVVEAIVFVIERRQGTVIPEIGVQAPEYDPH